MTTVYLDLETLFLIVEQAGLQAFRDAGLLESAALRPQTAVFGEDACPTIRSSMGTGVSAGWRPRPSTP